MVQENAQRRIALFIRDEDISRLRPFGRIVEQEWLNKDPRRVDGALAFEASSAHFISGMIALCQRYDSIWSDPARECWGATELSPPDHFG
jgi:hypothetical protein